MQPQPLQLENLGALELLNSLADGAYITDCERKILLWNAAAERITGWAGTEVVGRSCRDNILVHIDKDGHALCGNAYCPLHRAIITGQSSHQSLLVFAQHKNGGRIPVEVSVSPIRDKAGQIIGGIEVFRDVTEAMVDQIRAKGIQEHALQSAASSDPRLQWAVQYIPRDIVGGDFYCIEPVNPTCTAVMIADVMGHGTAAALYCMYLRSLWEDWKSQLVSPANFLSTLNRQLKKVASKDGYYATAVCLTLNADTGAVTYVRAGHPAPLVMSSTGQVQRLEKQSPALGLFEDTNYGDTTTQLALGDTLLLYTDGAIEVTNSEDKELGEDGLVELLKHESTQPGLINLEKVEEGLLRYSNQLRLSDDLTLMAVKFENPVN